MPHFQQSGQAYFVTWILKDAAAPKATKDYAAKLEMITNQIQFQKENRVGNEKIAALKNEYYSIRKKYFQAFDKDLALQKENVVDLSRPENLVIVKEALHFWNEERLKTIAYSIMPNHIHWVLSLFETDKLGKPVYLQDIMLSVKRFTSNRINKQNKTTGTLWHKESYDTTIRNEKHLYNAVEYTLNNPVNAVLVTDRMTWPGNFLYVDFY